MGLLSKLLGMDKKLEQTVKNAVNDAVNAALQNQNAARNVQNQPTYPQPSAQGTAPIGQSWGPVMPAEFPEYNITYGPKPRILGALFTFWSGTGKALVVEILPESSETVRVKKACAAQGVPYLRFYYNHHGWWNTRSYVTQRTRRALQG